MDLSTLHPVLLSDFFGFTEANKHIFYTWLAMAILFLFALILRGRMHLIPRGTQNFAEVLIGGLEDFTVNTIGEKGRIVFPLLCSIFLFILVQNLLGLVPGCDAPTANINTTAAMALFVFVYYNYVGFREHGIFYIKHFCGPIKALTPMMLPIEIVSNLARPLSLTLRLFGNIRGEELVLMLFFGMLPIISTLPVFFLFLLAKALQAFIFFMLTMIYLQGAMEEAH